MEFALLGPVGVTTGSGELPLGPAKRRSVLAMLLLQPNITVSVEQLITCLWEDEPPAHARTVVQGHVSRLRAALAEGGADAYGIELATRAGAYLLRLPEELIDAHRFNELLALARPEAAPQDAVPLLREALGLWRGPALSGTVAGPQFAAAAHALEERRLAAVEALARAHGALGEHERAAAVLYVEAAANPLREGLVAALMGALYRAGRQSDAINWFHRTRQLLGEELGVDPGERLSRAYEEILRAEAVAAAPSAPQAHPDPRAHDGLRAHGDPQGHGDRQAQAVPQGHGDRQADGVPQAYGDPQGHADPQARADRSDPARAAQGSPPPDSPPPPAAGHAVPRHLPRPPARFLGREAQLADLTRWITATANGESPVAVVTGPAGVGKTACAVQWAHLHAHAFPDGQLFADLGGFGEGDEAAPAAVLREFLLALGTPPGQIPPSAEAASALYRSIVARRKILVVLDNARSSAQVRPLLPGGTPPATAGGAPTRTESGGGAGCATLVTSRSRLDGLVATDCARPVPVQVLATEEGMALLGTVLGPERIADDPDAARELVGLCEGLPLALRAAAAQLTARPRWRLSRLAAALRDERRRLALLSAEDTGIAAALRTSVARLSADDARLLSALATGSGRQVDASAVAALAGADPDRTRDGLDRLAEMHLVDEEATDRYVISALVQLFARGGEPGEGDASGADSAGAAER
ncbi:BTAD domain-containing putative transcriptional regulator [Streptomyces sp. 7N604]|uniref:BTAD domain-containing putative transcriptional regulator n=1 Tax=Streptomyces sp. 7N604 TaxID=3457415 RepID=UPI003FD0BAF0